MKPLTVRERIIMGLELIKVANRYIEQGRLKEAGEILKNEALMLAKIKSLTIKSK